MAPRCAHRRFLMAPRQDCGFMLGNLRFRGLCPFQQLLHSPRVDRKISDAAPGCPARGTQAVRFIGSLAFELISLSPVDAAALNCCLNTGSRGAGGCGWARQPLNVLGQEDVDARPPLPPSWGRNALRLGGQPAGDAELPRLPTPLSVFPDDRLPGNPGFIVRPPAPPAWPGCNSGGAHGLRGSRTGRTGDPCDL